MKGYFCLLIVLGIASCAKNDRVEDSWIPEQKKQVVITNVLHSIHPYTIKKISPYTPTPVRKEANWQKLQKFFTPLPQVIRDIAINTIPQILESTQNIMHMAHIHPHKWNYQRQSYH